MKKYFFNDGKGQQGPFNIDELLTKNITTDTPVWSEGMEEWVTADQLDELKEFFQKSTNPVESSSINITEPVLTNITNIELGANEIKVAVSETIEPVPEVITKISEPVVISIQPSANVDEATGKTNVPVTEISEIETIKAEPVAQKTTAAAKRENVTNFQPITPKSKAWISWVFGLLVIGGVGYFVYQDIEKNKDNNTPTTEVGVNKTDTKSTDSETTTDATAITEGSITDTNDNTVSNKPVTTETTITEPTTVTTGTTTTSKNTQASSKQDELEKAKAATKAKAAVDVKKKQEATLTAQSSKEREMRNNWVKYVTFGNIAFNPKDDGIEEFNVPIYNGTNAVLDKVTIRVDYLKREGKIIKSETIVVNNVPPGSGINGKAPANKKARKVNTYFIGIYSKKLHFCFPQNNGSTTDPFFCN